MLAMPHCDFLAIGPQAYPDIVVPTTGDQEDEILVGPRAELRGKSLADCIQVWVEARQKTKATVPQRQQSVLELELELTI